MSQTYRTRSLSTSTRDGRILRKTLFAYKPVSRVPSMHSYSPYDKTIDRDALYEEFGPLIQKLIRRYGSDPELREDLQGEIYFRFCALLDLYDPSRGIPLRAYIVRQLVASVFTYARQYWRLNKREMELEAWSSDYHAGELQDPTPGWDDALLRKQLCGRLPEAIAQLPVRQAQVLVWRYFEERSYESIAETLSVQPATVRSLMRHAIHNLRRWFNISSTSTL